MANRSPEPMFTQRSLSILTASLVIGLCAGCLSFLATASASAACTAGGLGFAVSVPVLHRLVE